MSPWMILISQATTDVVPPVPHYYAKGKKAKRVLPTHCRQCGARLVLAPQAYTKIFCNVDCKKAFNRAAYAAKKLTAPSFNGAIGVAGVVGTTEGIW